MDRTTDQPGAKQGTSPPSALGALMHDLYERASEGEEVAELRTLACRGVAAIFGFPLVLLVRKCASGTAAVEAASGENLVWAELQRLPERWDGGVVGDGSAARALRERRPSIQHVTAEGFLPWRRAAERERIRFAGAWPIELPDGSWALEVFDAAADRLHDLAFTACIEAAAQALQRFLRNQFVMERRRLLAGALECAGNAAFVTDLEGTIVWANRAFARLSGHAAEDVVGRNPRLLQSGKQALRYYRDLWNTIRSGKVWSGETVDRDRDGNGYTIRQTISPVALNDRITHYVSIQHDITAQKAQELRREVRSGRDDATGLLTRAAFEQVVAKTLAGAPAPLAFIIVSLRPFHDAAARAGADAAEQVVAEMSDRIRTVIEAPVLAPAAATAAGAGEFFLMLAGDAAAPPQREQVLAELQVELERPYSGLRMPAAPVFRVSVARYPEDGADFDALMRAADRKLVREPIPAARRRIAP